jgi:hypothetical protein
MPILDPSTTSTSSLTHNTESNTLHICCLKSGTNKRNGTSRYVSCGCKGPTRLHSREALNSRQNLSTSATRLCPQDGTHTEVMSPPLTCHDETTFATFLGLENPYVSASAAKRAAQEAKIAAVTQTAKAARRASKIQEINCRRSELAEMEARLMNRFINSSSTDQVMGDCEGELAASHSAKKTSSQDGRAVSSSVDAASSNYFSPARASKQSKKRTQVLSPAAHYAGRLPSGNDESTSLPFFLRQVAILTKPLHRQYLSCTVFPRIKPHRPRL